MEGVMESNVINIMWEKGGKGLKLGKYVVAAIILLLILLIVNPFIAVGPGERGIKIEAEQKIAQATAEAEALRLQKANITPELVKLRQIEASIKAIDKWDGHLPKVTSGSVPFIDVKSFDEKK